MEPGDTNAPLSNPNEQPEDQAGGRPAIRIGDADRSAALDALGMHFADGRLTIAEFEERTGAAATAVTRADLAPLFADLPGGVPGSAGGRATTSPLDPRVSNPSAADSAAASAPTRSLLSSENELAELRNKGQLVTRIDSALWSIGFILFFVLMFTGITSYFWLALVGAGIGSVAVRSIVGFDDDDEKTFEALSKEEKRERRQRLKLADKRLRELEG